MFFHYYKRKEIYLQIKIQVLDNIMLQQQILKNHVSTLKK